VFNDVFVSALPGTVGLPFHSQSSRSLQYVCALICRSCDYIVIASCFPNVFQLSVQFFPFAVYLKSRHYIRWTVFFELL